MSRMAWHLARLIGVVALLAAVPVVVIGFVSPQPHWLIGGVSLAVVSLAGAAYADSRLPLLRAAQDRARVLQAQAWSGAEWVAGMRWLRWSLVVAVVLALTGGLIRMLQGGDSALSMLNRVLALTAIAGGVWLLATLAGAAVLVLRAGHVIRMDSRGASLAVGFTVQWCYLRGIDLLVQESRGGLRYYALILAVAPTAFENMPSSKVLRTMYGWLLGSADAARCRVRIPLNFINAEPNALLFAVKALATDAGAPLESGWRHYMSLDQATALREKEEMLVRLAQSVERWNAGASNVVQQLRRGSLSEADAIRLLDKAASEVDAATGTIRTQK